MSEHILTARADGVMRIEIRRPHKRNALDFAMYAALHAALEQGDADPAVHVMLLCGQAQVFSAGNDLDDFFDPRTLSLDSPVWAFMRTIAAVGKPLVAAVAGNAIGVGTTLLLHCDLVYAAESARFRLPFVPLGICPEFGSSSLLPQRIGHARAAELLFFGESFDAHTAWRFGLVNEVCGEAELMPRAHERARTLADLPQASLRLAKHLLKAPGARQTQQIMDDEMWHFMTRVRSDEARAAFRRLGAGAGAASRPAG